MPPVKISTIIFDFGGVVVQWDPRRVYRPLLEKEEDITRFFDEVGFAAWNLEQDRGRPWADAVSELSSRFPHHGQLIRAYDERWEDSIIGTIEGTVRIIEGLHASGYMLVGLTNWSADKFALTRRRYDVFSLFDEIVVSGEVGLVKPDSRIFEWMLHKIGRRREECLFIDDSAANVEAAASMGFATIRFESPAQLREELDKRGIAPEAGC